MSDDTLVALLVLVAIILLIWWTASLPLGRKATAIRISFSPQDARRFRWRRFWRFLVDTNIAPGEIKHGTLAILDQNGDVLPGATFDAQPLVQSSDPNVFTVVGDPNDFFGLDVTGIGSGVAQLTADGNSGGNPLNRGLATVTVAVTLTATSIDIRF